jgi:hypothetical protein
MGRDGSFIGRGDRLGAHIPYTHTALWVVLMSEMALVFAFSKVPLGRCCQSLIERLGSILNRDITGNRVNATVA